MTDVPRFTTKQRTPEVATKSFASLDATASLRSSAEGINTRTESERHHTEPVMHPRQHFVAAKVPVPWMHDRFGVVPL